MRRLPMLVAVGVLALVAARAFSVQDDLPAQVAIHFDGAGRADGWSSKGSFLVISLAILAFVGAIGLGLPLALARLPVAWINLPHRDHWLSPEHAPATRAWVQASLAWFGTATLAFTGCVLELTYRANLAGPGDDGLVRLSGHTWTALGAYFAFVAAWLVVFLRRFRR